ncbi:hypothetical protein [Variovorax saccharolyticus]|uniref:hypothetical protein n=1 Tax=Variovorax saccharolyticus TaxID=3053516 RepID=UPI0025761CF7|nr:hypothetical protein [Variovorax sp. J22R187]MDM0019370.1 hypothetical protein [Variovorax sp. J22R187]
MKHSFGKLFLLPLAILCTAGLGLAPEAEARPGGGGGGGLGHGGGGGGARAGGGAHAGGANRQVNNVNRDVRANNVRSTSVNNVNMNRNVNANVNRNVNVNVNNRGGWDNDYHPVATAAAVTAGVAVTAAVVGSMVRTVPPGCVPVNYGGLVYQQCGTVWYQPQGGQYVVINPPY